MYLYNLLLVASNLIIVNLAQGRLHIRILFLLVHNRLDMLEFAHSSIYTMHSQDFL